VRRLSRTVKSGSKISCGHRTAERVLGARGIQSLGPRASLVALSIAVIAVTAPARASAQTAVFVESESLLMGRRFGPVYVPEAEAQRCRENADASDYCRRLLMPFYEYVTLRARDIGTPGLAVEFAGWGVADLASRLDPTYAGRVPRTGDVITPGVGGDLLVGALTYRSPRGRLEARLGRQFLVVGAPYATTLDGLSVRYTFPHWIDVAVYGGGSTPRDATAGRDSWNALVGGRVGWSQLDRGSVGVSFLDEMDGDGDLVRRELGVDASWLLGRRVDLNGSVLWDLVEESLRHVEYAQVTASYGPIPRLRLSADYTFVVPSLLIPKTSIFSVFSDADYQDVGVDVTCRLTPLVRLSAALRLRAFTDGNEGWVGGAGARSLLRRGRPDVVGLDFQRLATRDANLAESGYWQLRLYGSYAPLARALVTLDGHYFHFDRDICQGLSVRDAGSVSATASYRLSSTMDVLVSATGNFNPTARSELLLLGRFSWHTWLLGGARRVEP
jgi:hypothetical protein